MERDGFCRRVTSKLNYFLSRDTKGQENNSCVRLPRIPDWIARWLSVLFLCNSWVIWNNKSIRNIFVSAGLSKMSYTFCFKGQVAQKLWFSPKWRVTPTSTWILLSIMCPKVWCKNLFKNVVFTLVKRYSLADIFKVALQCWVKFSYYVID